MSAAIALRKAVENDCATILQLMRELVEDQGIDPKDFHITIEDLQRDGFGEQKAFTCILAENNTEDEPRQAVGFAVYIPTYVTMYGRALFIEDMFVRKEYQSQGVGSALMTYLAKVAVAEGYKVMQWFCLGANEGGQRFYKRNGAINLTTDQDYHGMQMDFQALQTLASSDCGRITCTYLF